MTDVLRNFVEAAGPLQALVFVVAYVILTVLLVPGTISSVAAGSLFGPAWGTLLTLAGATIGRSRRSRSPVRWGVSVCGLGWAAAPTPPTAGSEAAAFLA